MYSMTNFLDTVIRDSDGTCIVILPTSDPSRFFNPLDRDYIEFKKWEDLGNTPKALTFPIVDPATIIPTQSTTTTTTT